MLPIWSQVILVTIEWEWSVPTILRGDADENVANSRRHRRPTTTTMRQGRDAFTSRRACSDLFHRFVGVTSPPTRCGQSIS